MRLIPEGSDYNITLTRQTYWGDYKPISYSTVVEPSEQEVVAMLNGSNITCIQYINYFLQETKAGYIFEAEDPVFVKAGFSYLECLKWMHRRYENKGFSWQKEESV